MASFKDYMKRNIKNKGLRWGDGCEELHMSKWRFDNPGQMKISEFRKIRDFFDIPEREMEQKILEIYRHGDLENRY